MKTIICPACKHRNDFEAANCARCGESLAIAKTEVICAEMRVSSARFRHWNAIREGSGFSTIYGWGTMLIDYRARGEGTYSAVRWVTAAGIPLIPLGTYVIQPHHQDHSHGGQGASFTLVERRPLRMRRVLRTYLMLVAGLLPLVAGWINSDRVNGFFGEGPAFFVMLATGIWAFYVVYFRIKNDGGVYKPLPPPVATR